MATKSGRSTLTGLVDSDSEGENNYIDNMLNPDSGVENKKGKGRPKASAPKAVKESKVLKPNAQKSVKQSKATKAKAPVRRTCGRLNAKNAPVEKKGRRKALADKTNQQQASDTEEVEEFDQAGIVEGAISGDELDNTIVAPPPETKPKATKTKRNTAAKKKPVTKKTEAVEPSPEKVIMETQVPEIDMEIDDSGNEEVEHYAPGPSRNIGPPRANSRIRQNSIQPRRPGSASDTEKNDPSIRRKLGEVTKKLENVELKYQDLREVGVKEAERNFERLKKQTEQKTNVANHLIASLKADVAKQSALAKEAQGLQKKLESQSTEMATLQAQLSEMTSSLKEVQSENKALSTKLAANGNVTASIESTNPKMPDSLIKPNASVRMMGTAEATQVAQAAQLKEDLYSDLTGLIMRGVKREAEEDVFDCIQTGRNGTLHFKLAVANEKSADSYDSAQCVYTPQLDPSRDKALVSLLPDYLSDEITFPRPQAAKFYARVMKALTEKPN